jgi:hypothetical protein
MYNVSMGHLGIVMSPRFHGFAACIYRAIVVFIEKDIYDELTLVPTSAFQGRMYTKPIILV